MAVSLTGVSLPAVLKGRLTLKTKQKHRVAKPQNLTEAATEIISPSVKERGEKGKKKGWTPHARIQ